MDPGDQPERLLTAALFRESLTVDEQRDEPRRKFLHAQSIEM